MRWLLVILLMQATAVSSATHKNVVTTEDVCLAWTVNDEARGESVKAQRAVLDVILHRMRTKEKSACSVVKEPHQFSGVKPNKPLKVDTKVLQNFFYVRSMHSVLSNKASFFHSGRKPRWAYKMKQVAAIGKLKFYSVS